MTRIVDRVEIVGLESLIQRLDGGRDAIDLGIEPIGPRVQLLQVRISLPNRLRQTQAFLSIVPSENEMPSVVRHRSIVFLMSCIARLGMSISSHGCGFAFLKFLNRFAGNVVET